MTMCVCPRCGHEFDGGIKVVSALPDPPPANPIPMIAPPPEGPFPGP